MFAFANKYHIIWNAYEASSGFVIFLLNYIISLFFCKQLHLALYSHNAGLVSTALKLMYRARYLALIVFGEGHPDMATFDVRMWLDVRGTIKVNWTTLLKTQVANLAVILSKSFKVFSRSSKNLPWSCHDLAMILSWSCRDLAMILPWFCHDFAMILPWSCRDLV